MAILADKLYEAKANGVNLLGDRVLPWDNIGENVVGADSIEDVMRMAGLDFTVATTPLSAEINGIAHPTGHFATYRTDTNDILGVVKGRYEVVDNIEAFNFIEDIVGNGNIPVRYNTAGVLKGGKRTWISCELPKEHILGDEFKPYLVFANSHDGSTGITVSITNIRVWCLNTLNMAIKTGTRAFSFTHSTNVKTRMEEAKKTLENYSDYQKKYAIEANRLYEKKLSNADIKALFDKLFPVNDNTSDRVLVNTVAKRSAIETAYGAYDIQHNFANTAWGVLNAIGDFTSHEVPLRKTDTFREKRVEGLWNGYKLFDKAYSLIA